MRKVQSEWNRELDWEEARDRHGIEVHDGAGGVWTHDIDVIF
jgi:hypothetical protein